MDSRAGRLGTFDTSARRSCQSLRRRGQGTSRSESREYETNFPPEEEKKHDDEGTAAAAGGSSHKGGGGGDAVYNAPSGSAKTDSSRKKAYTLELEAEIDKFKEFNQRLKKEQEEIIEAQSNKEPFPTQYLFHGNADDDDDFQKIKDPKKLDARCMEETNMDIERPYTASELVGSQEDFISQNLHQLNLGEISRQRKLDGLREDNNMVKQKGYSINELVQEAQTRWLKPAEVYFILQNYKDHQITVEVPQKPPSGSLFLFNKRVCRFFRKDGHSWRKKKDGRTVGGEAYERLKVGNVESMNCYYAHGDQNPNFQRRSFWVLDPAFEHIVLVHYREISEVRLNSASVSRTESTCVQYPASTAVITEFNDYPSPEPVEVNSDAFNSNYVTDHVRAIGGKGAISNPSELVVNNVLRRLREKLSFNDNSPDGDSMSNLQDDLTELVLLPEPAKFSESELVKFSHSRHGQVETMSTVLSESGINLKPPSRSERGQKFLDDGYSWINYGKKESNGVLMNYYKCAYPKCEVRRRCVLSSSDGHVEVTYKGNHHHSKSETTRRSPPSSTSDPENESTSDESPGQSIVSRGILETDGVGRKEELKPLVGFGQMSFKAPPPDQPLGLELYRKDKNKTGASPEYDGRTQQHLEEAVSILQPDPVEIFANKVSIIHTLDLSHTSIKHLPEFISKLVALRVLILRGCELLMELRPEIGELTNLEVLDLEGTEIICLPKEIAKLTNLRSLKFSLCGYADQFQETKQIGPIIPRKALSNLLQLNELSIDVIPDGDWWNIEVKSVVDELRSLQKLRTLCLYLPTVDLLDKLIQHFILPIYPAIPRFRFTVGYDEERLISRLPQEVVKEFLDLVKFEKGLKYVNGEGIPIEVKKALKHMDAFLLERHWTIKNLLEFGLENIDGLKMCILLECNELQTVVNSKQVKDFDGAILGSLEYLSIHYMKNMERIWRGPVGKGSLSNLKSLALHTCVSLTTIFTQDLLANLLNLEDLRIEDCPKVETLVSSSSPDLVLRYFLPNLKKMFLIELPNLGCISSCLPIAPKLERLVIFYCPKLDRLSPIEISNRNLKVIKGEKLWWDALKWGESGLMEDGQGYLASKFIPLRKDEDLEEQFMRD